MMGACTKVAWGIAVTVALAFVVAACGGGTTAMTSSPTRRDEYHADVSLCRIVNRSPLVRASSSLNPTRASGGIVKTTLGTAVYAAVA